VGLGICKGIGVEALWFGVARIRWGLLLVVWDAINQDVHQGTGISHSLEVLVSGFGFRVQRVGFEFDGALGIPYTSW
jgi:hypothetical protein